MDKINQLEQDIKNLNIQGATNIALAVLDGIKFGTENQLNSVDLENIGNRLAYVRPTEPLAQNALRFIFQQKDQEAPYYLERAEKYKSLIISAKVSMAQNAEPLIADGGTYLTHCHSSTVVSVFTNAWQKGLKFQVIATETRPRFQGRITVNELLDNGIENITMIVDDAAISILLGGKKKIDAVFIGADLLAGDGFINKVGSLGIAYAANKMGIPLYTLSILLKYNPILDLAKLLDERPGQEIWPDAPPSLSFYAPAFDFIPYSTGVKIVSESGIIESGKITDSVYNTYPFLRK